MFHEKQMSGLFATSKASKQINQKYPLTGIFATKTGLFATSKASKYY